MKKLLLVSLLIKLFFLSSAFSQSFNGRSTWNDQFDVVSMVSASIIKMHVVEGQKIKKGDLLISMDQTLLALALDIAKAQVASEGVTKQQAEMDYNRALELYDRTLLSDVELKLAEFEFNRAKALFDIASAKMEQAKFLLNAAQIRSPINGFVLKRHALEGFYSDTDSSPVLLSLVNVKKLFAVTNLKVSQWDSSLLHKKVSIVIKDKTYQGKVISLALLPVVNLKGLSEYPMVVEFKADFLMPAGMPLTINIQ